MCNWCCCSPNSWAPAQHCQQTSAYCIPDYNACRAIATAQKHNSLCPLELPSLQDEYCWNKGTVTVQQDKSCMNIQLGSRNAHTRMQHLGGWATILQLELLTAYINLSMQSSSCCLQPLYLAAAHADGNQFCICLFLASLNSLLHALAKHCSCNPLLIWQTPK